MAIDIYLTLMCIDLFGLSCMNRKSIRNLQDEVEDMRRELEFHGIM